MTLTTTMPPKPPHGSIEWYEWVWDYYLLQGLEELTKELEELRKRQAERRAAAVANDNETGAN